MEVFFISTLQVSFNPGIIIQFPSPSLTDSDDPAKCESSDHFVIYFGVM